MAGRPPKPTALKELAGNPGKRTLNPNEPKPPVETEVPKPPGHLGRMAKTEWRRVAQLLHRMGLLTEIDTTALAMYCQLYERWAKAERSIRKDGMITIAGNGFPVQNPAVGIANGAMKQMRQMLTEFGMTPSSRSRVTVNAPEEPDDYESFLNG